MTVAADPGTDAGAPSAAAPQRRDVRFGVSWLAALLVLGLLTGAVGTLWAVRGAAPGDDSVEAGFLRDMSTHHAQAVEMAMIAHANSTNPDIVSLAADIATTQQGQIGYMQSWLREWGLDPTGDGPPMQWMHDAAGAVRDGLMPGMATPAQMDALRKATGTEVDVQFLTLMRAHHLGGVHMAQDAVEMSDDGDVDWIARSMVTAQQGEITLIDDLLTKVRGSR